MNDTQRKWKKQISRDSWMLKLQRLCFGNSTPKFIGYCPFFWFTWFCLVALPFALPIRAVVTSIVAIWSLLPYRDESPTRPADSILVEFYKLYLEHGSSIEAIKDTLTYADLCVLEWIEITPDWENCAKQAVRRYTEKQTKREKRMEAAQSRSEFLRKLSAMVAPVFKVVLIALGLALTLLAGRAFFDIFRHITFGVLIVSMEVVGGALIASVVIVGICKMISAILAIRRKCPKDPNHVGIFARAGYALGDGIGNALEFIVDTVEAIYTRECPLIEWGEETQPISRNGE